MILTGVLANAAAVFLGGLLGVICRKGISEQLNKLLTDGLGLCVVTVGISGILSGGNTIIMVCSIVAGTVGGYFLKFDYRLNRFGSMLQSKFQKGDSTSSFAAGFINCSLFICVGAMAIVGSLQSGLEGNHETLLTKSLIDGFVAFTMAAALGAGVCFSAVPVFIYQAILTLGAHSVAPFLTDTVITEMTCVGSLLIIAIGLNMLNLTEIKIADYLLAPFLPIFLCLIM